MLYKRIISKFSTGKIANRILITIFILMAISLIGGGEGSLFGFLSPILFKFITFPLFYCGLFLLAYESILPFFRNDYFGKDFTVIMFLFHCMWIAFIFTILIFLTLQLFKYLS